MAELVLTHPPSDEPRQVGGKHYLGMAMQPRVFAMRNRWDCDAFSILKCLSRYPAKAGIEDVRKALHFAEMRAEFAPPPLPRSYGAVRMAEYLVVNGLTVPVGAVRPLYTLEGAVHFHGMNQHLIVDITRLLEDLERRA